MAKNNEKGARKRSQRLPVTVPTFQNKSHSLGNPRPKEDLQNQKKEEVKPSQAKRSISKWLKRLFFRMPETTPFRLDEATLKKVAVDEAKLYLEVAEKQLEDSVETGQIITERATNMLNLTSGILIALIAYSIDKWETNPDFTRLLIMALCGCGALTIMSGLLVVAILPRDYCIPGSAPRKIFESKAFRETADSEERQKKLCFNLLTSYQRDIEENISLNKKRWLLFNLAMFLMLITPIVFASYYLFFR